MAGAILAVAQNTVALQQGDRKSHPYHIGMFSVNFDKFISIPITIFSLILSFEKIQEEKKGARNSSNNLNNSRLNSYTGLYFKKTKAELKK
ncbi:hypothetical protein EZS27_012932 [termite gut metagenome]|uniref:Uncharacterized protein n=1 Tax=termite gut metagenome TaxID=433724 RepID=A0A5J4RYV9_9ZZZZ